MIKQIYLIGLGLIMPLEASAACLDDVDAFASKYGISTALPHAASDARATSEQLAQSGGVIAPPPTNDPADVAPPLSNPEPMKTAPDLPAQTATTSSNNSTNSSSVEAGAADKTQISSLLMAAREAGKNGQETICQQRLTDALQLQQKSVKPN